MGFKIGDIVRVKEYADLPESIKNKGLGKCAGKEGKIVDVMYSNAKDCYVYKIRFEDTERPSRTDFPEGSFEHAPSKEQVEYTYEFEYLENLVVARLYEVTETSKTELAKGHGHIFHDGVVGVAQAASYALKRIYHKLSDGEVSYDD